MRLHRAGFSKAAALALLAPMLALGLARAVAAPAAQAVTHAEAAATEQDGFGRITLSFDALPSYSVEDRNGILIARFGQPVDVDIGPVAEGLPHFVSLGRRDPDRRALRFSLSQDVSLHLLQGGDTLFIDLLPRNWVGMPPGLPASTLADMNRRLQRDRAVARAAAEDKIAALPPLTLRAGTHDGAIRVVFAPGGIAAEFRRDGDEARVSVAAPVPFDLAKARAALPPAITGLRTEVAGGRRIVSFVVPHGWKSTSFHEDGDLVVALTAGGAGAPSALRTVPLAPAKPAAAPGPASPADPPTTGSIAPAETAPPPRGLRPEVKRTEGSTTLTFPFAKPPAAAAFQRGRYLWLLFDSTGPIDLSALPAETDGAVAAADTIAADPGQALLLSLADARPATLSFAGGRWVVTLGGATPPPAGAIGLLPGAASDGRPMLVAALGQSGGLHWLTDPVVGDRIAVVTLPPPLRRRGAGRAFVDFDALATLQGLALRTDVDDLTVGLAGGTLTVTRRAGLTLSPPPAGGAAAAVAAGGAGPFDRGEWQALQAEPYYTTLQDLQQHAATASAAEQPAAYLALARFQLAQGNGGDALAAVKLAVSARPQLAHDAVTQLIEGAALVDLRRFDRARQVLEAEALAADQPAALWRAVAEVGLDDIAAAHRSFTQGAPILPAMPDPLQLRFRLAEVEIALAMQNFADAAAALDEADAIAGGSRLYRRDLLRGRIAEGRGEPGAALEAYRAAIAGNDAIAAAAATLRATRLRYRRKDIDLADAIRAMEGLAVMWRGDDIEARTLAFLTHLYGDDQRWRDAFTTLRTAVQIYPDAASTRGAQDEMAAAFARLYLDDGTGAAPPTLASLALFYDFRELIPPGRRGDEMIRRLADRLVKVDLLDQAGDLLDYQVMHRLAGIARATVAARAAFVHLLDHQPRKAYDILQKTRIAGLPQDIVDSRLTMEARADADLGRPDLALELVAGLDGPDVRRLRSDIQWGARRWQAAGEALELVVGDAWKEPAPLDTTAASDVLRAAVAYALADDPLGLDRIRARFGPKMKAGPDGAAFDAVTAPLPRRGAALQDVARAVTEADTLAAFIADFRRHHPEAAVGGTDQAAAGSKGAAS
ncbi:MAG TPA: hypothetical protein VHD15_16390 [Hyphomicrobiales bacterium]|nr:hypothetical protein [Hyphomicrobiales bacterium]